MPCHGAAVGGCWVRPMLPALLQPLLLPPLPFGFNFSPSSRCPNGTPGAPHQQQQTAAENIPPDSRDWHGPSAPLPGQRPVAQPVALFMGICKKKKHPKNPILGKWAMLQAGSLAKGTSGFWCFLAVSGFSGCGKKEGCVEEGVGTTSCL